MKKIKINEDACIRCGACAYTAKEYIKLDENDGRPVLLKDTVDENDKSIIGFVSSHNSKI